MSKKEKNKVILDFIKTALFALLTALFGIFAFLVVNIEKIILVQAIASAVGILIIAGCAYYLFKYLLKLLKELEEMQ